MLLLLLNGNLLRDGGINERCDLVDLGRLGHIQEAGANHLLNTLYPALVIVAVEQPGQDTDRDTLEQDDLEHLAVDRGRLQVEQLS